MTPEQLQAHAAALGYPWVAMDLDGTWLMYDCKPQIRGFNLSFWRCDDPGHRNGVYITANIAYTGRWQDSLRGPKENK
jgi:hypothetical protein